MSLKNPKRTAQRIITMVESGDYDPLIIEHMVESLVVGRDRKIMFMQKKKETAEKPRIFDISLKRISGALTDTIKMHGPITKDFVPSAAKRIYGNCQQIIEDNPVNVRMMNGEITVTRDKNSTHKLTVARDGNIRIKVASGSSNDEANLIIELFTKAAADAILLNKGTLRGKLSIGDIYKPECNGIMLHNDSKTERFKLDF